MGTCAHDTGSATAVLRPDRAALPGPRAEAELLRDALNRAGIAFWDWNARTGEAHFSPDVYRMLGYEPGAFPAHYDSWLALLPPDEREETAGRLARQIEQGRDTLELTYCLLTRTGQRKWIQGRAWVMSRCADGQAERIIGMNTDVTELHDVRNRLIRSQSLLRGVLESIETPVFSIDRDYRYTSFNQIHASFMELLYGVRIELGMSLLEAQTVEADRVVARANLERAMRGEHIVVEAESGDEERSRRQFEIWHSPSRRPDGTIDGAVVMAVDITVRRQAQEALKESAATLNAVTAAAHDAIIVLDAQGRASFWNPAAAQLLGWTPEEVHNVDLLDALFAETPPDSLRGYLATLLAGGQDAAPSRTFDLGVRHRDGTAIPVEASLAGVRLDGRPHIVGIFRGTAERRLNEVEVRQAQKLESIGRLAAGIAHEINTPTQFIGDNLRFLHGAQADMRGVMDAYRRLRPLAVAHDPEAAAALDDLERRVDVAELMVEIPQAVEQSIEGIERVTQIVRAMKDYVHPGTALKQPVDLNQIVQTCVTVSRNAWKRIAVVETDLAERAPVVVGHAADLHQTVLNLVMNAAQAIAETGAGEDREPGVIRIRTGLAGDEAVVTVSDTGAGIAPQHRDHVFDPFFTTKAPGEGTGQGLAIAYGAVVRKHGGKLTFESEVGAGTTFTIRLPVLPDEGGT